MPGYRIYWLDCDKHIIGADNLSVDTDEEALAAAQARIGTASAIAVWRGLQCIGHMSAKKPLEQEFKLRHRLIAAYRHFRP